MPDLTSLASLPWHVMDQVHDNLVTRQWVIKGALAEHAIEMAKGVKKLIREAPQLPLGFVSGFEQLIVDAHKPKYIRMLAWYRLLRVWTCLRFDDHRGLLPSSFHFVNGSVRGTLVRA